MSINKFDRNDDDYLHWMAANPDGFIVNTLRGNSSNYFVLHKSNCRHISILTGLRKGAYTERAYIKLCSNDVKELICWLKQNNNKFQGKFDECKTCCPIP